jgi:hypothetical protein
MTKNILKIPFAFYSRRVKNPPDVDQLPLGRIKFLTTKLNVVLIVME